MPYKVRVRKSSYSETGYFLTYGKGTKEINGLLRKVGAIWLASANHDPDGYGNTIASHSTKRDTVAAWGTWAAAQYAGTAPEDPTPAPSPVPEAPDTTPPADPQTRPLTFADAVTLDRLVRLYGPGRVLSWINTPPDLKTFGATAD